MTNVSKPTGSEGALLGSSSSPPSFASLFKTYNHKPVDLTPATYRSLKKDGKLAISFSKQDIERGQTLLATFAVILKFSSQRPSLSDIRGSITRDWNIMGEFTMGIIDYRHILVRFEAESEVTKALLQQNPNCLGIRFKVFRWFSGFNCKKDPALAPVWVELPDLPLDLFHHALLESIGQNIGKFLSIDKSTLCYTRPNTAKICVEMNLQEDMPDSIWLEGPNFPGFWQEIQYPNFLYCSSCAMIGHSWEFCRKRNKVIGPKEHLNTKGVQQSKKTDIQTTSWRQAKIKQFYRPTGRMVEQFQEGETSGAKDSNGNEIQTAPADLPTQTIQQVKPASSSQLNHESAPVQAGVTSENLFSILEDLEEDISHIDSYTENPNSAFKDQHHTKDNAPFLEPGISRLEEQYTTCIEEEAKKDGAVIIPALAQLYPPEPSDQFQGIAEHLQYELSTVKSPLLLTNDDTEPEKENDIDGNQALVTYGSDTEVMCKSKKSYPPLTMLITRSKTQGSTSSSKKGYQCCKD
ncbi:zinc ion binding / nucleic acid binding protein [Thalictrum thalictroides]|uniref:Zinc ion binding / nucleic acid binding protein n=1 Tax=Thalictrum thalictroides TaxID=46969 RepID=A0A7J6XBY3_THATH|nr:zinc ion binding / nucleic acid binding protein [Thalictrum thalictroides]